METNLAGRLPRRWPEVALVVSHLSTGRVHPTRHFVP